MSLNPKLQAAVQVALGPGASNTHWAANLCWPQTRLVALAEGQAEPTHQEVRTLLVHAGRFQDPDIFINSFHTNRTGVPGLNIPQEIITELLAEYKRASWVDDVPQPASVKPEGHDHLTWLALVARNILGGRERGIERLSQESGIPVRKLHQVADGDANILGRNDTLALLRGAEALGADATWIAAARQDLAAAR